MWRRTLQGDLRRGPCCKKNRERHQGVYLATSGVDPDVHVSGFVGMVEEYDPAAPACDVSTADDLLRLLGVVSQTSALLPPVHVAGQFLSLPPQNDIYELAWCPERGGGFMVQHAGQRLFVDGRQDVRHNISDLMSMRQFIQGVLTPALFCTRMADTGARIDLAWDEQTARRSGVFTLLTGCNRAGCMCDSYSMGFTCEA